MASIGSHIGCICRKSAIVKSWARNPNPYPRVKSARRPVDEYVDSGDKAGITRRQEEGRGRDLFGPADRGPGYERDECVDHLPRGAVEDGGADRARAKHVDADIAHLQVNCPGPRERAEGGLACAIHSQGREALHVGDGSDNGELRPRTMAPRCHAGGVASEVLCRLNSPGSSLIDNPTLALHDRCVFVRALGVMHRGQRPWRPTG